MAIHGLETDYVITDDENEFLTTYLYAIEEWTEYELYILGNTFVNRDKLYRALPSHKKRAELVFLNLILILIERKKFYHASYFIRLVRKPKVVY